jgi:hypothetical protein
LNERVVVDNDGWQLFGTKGPALPAPLKSIISVFLEPGRESGIVIGALDEKYAHYDRYPADKEFDELQARLCPAEAYACAIRTMKWYKITINNLKPVDWMRDAIQSLVIEDRTKYLLRGLVEQHKKTRDGDELLSDFIPNKGQVI